MGAALRKTLAEWWRQMIDYAILNVLWVGFSLTIVGAPPALAAMYDAAHAAAERDPVDWRRYGSAMKALFGPAWRWGLLQIAVYGIGGFNFLYYSYASGTFWAVLRVIWFALLVVWSVLNLLYWPFFMEETDRRLTNTYRNALVLCATRPGLVLGLVTTTIVVAVLCLLTGLLFLFALMPLLALLGTFAVRGVLTSQRDAGRLPLDAPREA